MYKYNFFDEMFLQVIKESDNEEPRVCLPKISKPNAKIPHWSFSLPSGFTCPFADKCLAKADRETGKIKDGPMTDFRCFSASTEALRPNVRANRWNNFDALRSVGITNSEKMAHLIMSALNYNLPRSEKIFRIHVGGDFFNEPYFNAWKIIAENMKDILFYAYTKSIPYVVSNLPLPENLRITASKGGVHDELIDKHNLKYAEVVFSPEEAQEKGLEIDHDDSHAWKDDKPFALLLHGVQPKDSKAAQAMKSMKASGIKSGYSKNKPKEIDFVKRT